MYEPVHKTCSKIGKENHKRKLQSSSNQTAYQYMDLRELSYTVAGGAN